MNLLKILITDLFFIYLILTLKLKQHLIHQYTKKNWPTSKDVYFITESPKKCWHYHCSVGKNWFSQQECTSCEIAKKRKFAVTWDYNHLLFSPPKLMSSLPVSNVSHDLSKMSFVSFSVLSLALFSMYPAARISNIIRTDKTKFSEVRLVLC